MAPHRKGRMAETAETAEETTSEETTSAAETEETSEETTAADPDWKRESRKHERRAKDASKELEKAQQRLKELEDANATEQEKAIAQAREEAATQAKAEIMGEVRKEKFSAAVVRRAAGKFEYPDDVERLLDLDLDDIFDDEGKVQTDALDKALDDLLESRPKLAADPSNGRPSGDADAGKGSGPGKSLDDMSVEDHAKRRYGSRA